MVLRSALGVHATLAVDRTRVGALAADAGFAVLTFVAGLAGWLADASVAESIGRAVRLGFAADRGADASNGSVGCVALVTLTTDACGFVIGRKTIGIGSAGESSTDVLAFRLASFTSTDGRLRTILILATLDRLLAALFVRFADSSSRAETLVRSSGVLATSAGRARFLQTVIDRSTTGGG